MIFKTKSKTFIFLCTVMCGLSLFFYSCNNPAAFSGDGSISFELPKTDQARLTSGDISFYDISVQSSDGTVVFQNNKFTGGTCTVPNLNSGNYTISIKGYTSDSTRSYLVTQGTNTATVTAGNTSAVSITLKGYAFFINQSDSVFGWAKGDDSNSGNSPSFPLYNLQSAVEKILEKNDGETEYRIYVAGALAPRNKEELNVPSTASSRGVGTAEDSVVMADFTSLKNGNLNVFIEGVGSGAALNGGRTYGGTIIAGNSDTSIPGLNLTLKNLSISNDAEAPSINLNGATLNIEGEITVKNPMTVYGSSETSATKINAVNEDSFIKTEDNTSAVRILTNASLKMNADGKFKLSVSGDDTICSMPFVLIEGGNLEANNCSFSNRKIES
ncbi:MAG: hypothetical protein HUK25_01305, partial [Treponema sp.]|nr:hypothetical protein [Treponema sp.]